MLVAPCEDTDVAMTDKSVFTPGMLGAVYSVWLIWRRDDNHVQP